MLRQSLAGLRDLLGIPPDGELLHAFKNLRCRDRLGTLVVVPSVVSGDCEKHQCQPCQDQIAITLPPGLDLGELFLFFEIECSHVSFPFCCLCLFREATR